MPLVTRVYWYMHGAIHRVLGTTCMPAEHIVFLEIHALLMGMTLQRVYAIACHSQSSWSYSDFVLESVCV